MDLYFNITFLSNHLTFITNFQLQNEPNLDNNDYIREYFQSQEALYRQQIEVRRQYRGKSSFLYVN